jgi:hypothetical protein
MENIMNLKNNWTKYLGGIGMDLGTIFAFLQIMHIPNGNIYQIPFRIAGKITFIWRLIGMNLKFIIFGIIFGH